MSERIKGVPIGTRIDEIGSPKTGQHYISEIGKICTATSNLAWIYPIIVPDNVYGVIDLATVRIRETGFEIPSGYQPFFAVDPDSDTWYIGSSAGNVLHASCMKDLMRSSPDTDSRRIHVRQIKPKTRRVLVGEVEIPIVPGDRPAFSIGACESITESGAKLAIDGLLYYPSAKLRHARIEERPCE